MRTLIAVLGAALAAAALLTPLPPGAAPVAPAPAATATSPSSPSVPASPTSPDADSAFGSRLYVDPTSDARLVADALAAAGDARRAALIEQIASQPTAVWLGDWYGPALLSSVIQRHLRAAAAQGATPVFVTYAIPDRDCGGYSAGGFTPDQYLDWNRRVAAALAGSRAVVLIEPDSLAMLPSAKCAGIADTRLPLLRSAVGILAAAGLSTYLDGGNARWLSPDAQATYLKAAGVADARGFFTNVSNFDTTQAERDYAGKVSSRVGWTHFVIDVSRNGNGWTGDWCNPPGAALGQNPQITESPAVKLDALLWVKHPGRATARATGVPPPGAGSRAARRRWWWGAPAVVSACEPAPGDVARSTRCARAARTRPDGLHPDRHVRAGHHADAGDQCRREAVDRGAPRHQRARVRRGVLHRRLQRRDDVRSHAGHAVPRRRQHRGHRPADPGLDGDRDVHDEGAARRRGVRPGGCAADTPRRRDDHAGGRMS